ncbi:hypothetical protein CCH79_00007937, partial [Gambusia affinis]
MYYAKLIIDRSAIKNISSKLNFYVTDNKVNIENVKMTTKCENNSNGNKTCECEPGHKWSDDVRLQGVDCNEKNCTLSAVSNSTCTLNTTGMWTFTLRSEGHSTWAELAIIRAHKVISVVMANCYDSVGSIIVDFTMKIVSDVSSGELFNKSTNLTKTLEGKMTLETKGIVNLEITKKSVPYDNSTAVTCKTERELKVQPQWNLKREDGEFLITNGSISTVEIKQKESKVTILSVNELWQGEYICLFVENEGQITINHKANDTLDVCLKPKIDISADPAFPLCKTDSSVFIVIVKCEIKNTTEKYNVSWPDGVTTRPLTTDNDKLVYSAQKVVGCDKKNVNSSDSPEVYCDFTNECNQRQRESMTVNVIYPGEKYCSAEGEWGNTKAGFPAVIKCKDKAGTRERTCSH